jgi:predicted alpha/beta superfamily hydrolase
MAMMKPEVVNVSGKECYLYVRPQSKYLLIQPVDEHDLELLDREVELVEALSGESFSLVAFRIEDWNRELTPWTAPPVFGKEPFGNGAEETLAFVTGHLLPMLREKGVDASLCLLGGYSLAGLFALWAAYQTDAFEGIAAASPSVWYPGWLDYALAHKPQARSVYLSLGDKEEKAKNPVMAQVGNAIRRQEGILREQEVKTVLEWNVGNHFVDSEKRMAKGFVWLMKHNTICQK